MILCFSVISILTSHVLFCFWVLSFFLDRSSWRSFNFVYLVNKSALTFTDLIYCLFGLYFVYFHLILFSFLLLTLGLIYALNIEAPKYIKQILINIKGEIDSNTIIIGDFNTPLKLIGRFFRQKNQQENSDFKQHTRSDEFN